MAKKLSPDKQAISQRLQRQLAEVAQAYALELHRQWGMERTPDDYWIGGEEHPCGAPYQMHTFYFIPFDEMQYIVENGIAHEEYEEYNDYLLRVVSATSQDYAPPFREWREHPERRISTDALERIQMLRDQLDGEIERVVKLTADF